MNASIPAGTAAKTTSSSDYLLDENFAALLTEEQNQLKGLLIRLSEGLNKQDIASPTFEPVVELLKRYGLKTLK